MKPDDGDHQSQDGADDRDPRPGPRLMGGSLSRLGLCCRANQPGHQAGAQAVAEPLPRIGKPHLGYRGADGLGGHRERIHARGQRQRPLGEELGEFAGQPRQMPARRVAPARRSFAIARALKSRANSREMLRSSTAAIEPSSSHSNCRVHQRVRDRRRHPDLVGVAGFPRPRPAEPSRRGRPARPETPRRAPRGRSPRGCRSTAAHWTWPARHGRTVPAG